MAADDADRVLSTPKEDQQHEEMPTKVVDPRPNLLKRLWIKSGLQPVQLILMMKGAMPPVISLAAYQSDAWARKYTTLGYLIAIMSLLSLPIQPRAKFLQSILISCFVICLG